MNPHNVALLLLVVSSVGLEVCGIWILRISQGKSQDPTRNLGIAVCITAFVILVVGIIGLELS